jgi:hypothetical protein
MRNHLRNFVTPDIIIYLPFVISFNMEGLAYSDGFKNPIGFLPTPSLASFSLVITAEKKSVY